MQKTLIIVGAVLIAAGVLWPLISKIGFGQLPGDIAIEREGFAFYLPVTTMILISVAATLLFRLFGK